MARLLPFLMLTLPSAAAVAAWLGTGRERLTKSGQWITIEVMDDVWGAAPQRQWQAGPLFGYHLGLIDGVLPVVGGAALLAVVAWWWLRRRSRARVRGGTSP